MTTYEYASSKLGAKLKAKTRAITREVFDAAQRAGHDIWFMWGMGSSAEHKTGRAIDFMVRNHAGGQWVRDYIWANRARLGLQHVIWEQHITSTVTQPGKVRKMEDRGNSTKNHMDHVHAFFFDGTYKPPAASKPAPAKTEVPGQLVVDGVLGSKTIAKWQHEMGTPVDGKISHPDSELIRRVQWRIRSTVDPHIGITQELDRRTIEGLQRYLKTPVTHAMDHNTIAALQRRLNTGTF